MLTVEEAAAELGITSSTVRSWILRRKIGYTKIGRSVRINTSEVARIIAEGTVPAERRAS